MEEFSTFMWIDLTEPPNWSDVEACIKYLREEGVPVDDVKCFDQVTNLRKFTEKCNHDEEFSGLHVHRKWTEYFEKAKSTACYSELLKIAQFVFALPSHNANIEKIFSLMQSQWTKERNCSVTEEDSISATQFERHFLQRLFCLFVEQPKTAGKYQLFGKIRLGRQGG